ncbi:MAG: HEAT repeat domain-containing protein [Spirochaetales bacterium]|nr:HEAT repeat domain-containing protein [Spirochaetales bacterium]
MNRIIVAALIFASCMLAPAWSQAAAGTERTVEESYLQDSLENMIIREQAYAESRDMKMLAIQFAKNAVDEGRTGPELQKSLEYLALETTMTIVRSGGVGRIINNFPDVRREACLLLGEFKTVEAKDALLKVALADNEPMVIAAAIRSIGKIGLMDGDDVTQTIASIVKRFDVLFPDNTLAYESLIAIEALADANKGIKDPAVIATINLIAEGNYVKPVKDMAKEVKLKLMKYSAGGK